MTATITPIKPPSLLDEQIKRILKGHRLQMALLEAGSLVRELYYREREAANEMRGKVAAAGEP